MTPAGLYWLFVKYGLLCFGGGYALVPLLTSDLVDARGLMSAAEFGRLLAVAQVTPGPIGINTATYVGFKLFGVAGAVVGTLGLVTPALVLVLTAMKCIARWEKSLPVAGALAGLRPAAFGLLLTAVVVFAEISVFTGKVPVEYLRGLMTGQPAEWTFFLRPIPFLIAVAAFGLQWKTRISFLWLIVAAAVFGALFCRV